MAEDRIKVICPNCGHEHEVAVGAIPVQRRAKDPLRKARMAWSNKTGQFHRTMMTDLEWGQYRRKGSID